MNFINFLGMSVVASTKETNSKTIMVYTPSLNPAADGRVVADAQKKESKSVDSKGQTTTSNVLTSATFPAIWKPIGDTNRLTPPDVREGSQVAIYQASGQDTYYWTTFGVNAATYRLETVVYGWSANPNINENVELDLSNYYMLTVSTHTGKISFRTSQKNGEKTTLEILIDAMAGKIYAGGKNKNTLVFDDIEDSLTFINRLGTVLDVNKKKITAYAPESINFNTDEEFNVLTKNLNIQTKKMRIGAETIDIVSPKNTLEGDVKMKGKLDITGSISTTGNIESQSDVIASGISLKSHKHGGVQSGGSTTQGPQ